MAYPAIIFDMDGLMLDTESVALRAFKKAADELGYPVTHEQCLGLVGRNHQSSLAYLREALGADYPGANVYSHACKLYIEDIETNGLRVKDGLFPLLETLKALGVPRIVATSTETELAKSKLTKTGILPYFPALVGGDQVSRGKPDPEIFLRAASVLDIHPERCFVLEDSEAGVIGAASAGMSALMVPDQKAPSQDVQKLASRIFKSLTEAHGWLLENVLTRR